MANFGNVHTGLIDRPHRLNHRAHDTVRPLGVRRRLAWKLALIESPITDRTSTLRVQHLYVETTFEVQASADDLRDKEWW